MFRFFFVAIAIALLVYLVRMQWRSRSSRPNKALLPEVEVVRCKHCDLHLPRADAIIHGTSHYCCPAHLPKEKKHP